MDVEARPLLEHNIRQKLDEGDLKEAIRLVVEGYGPEIFGYLVRTMSNDDDASEVFSQFCEAVCRGLGSFQGRSSCRTWVYCVATRARARLFKDPYRRRTRRLETDEISKLAQDVRSRTLTYLRGEVKDRFAKLREQLDAEERTLLMLRVDQQMSWPQIAEVLCESDESLLEVEVASRAAKWRQRFKRLKDKIHKLAAQEGIFENL